MISKHPKALPNLFLTEMWERFGFYIIEGFLILYMTQVFNFTDSKGYAILGAFTAMVYIAPVFGGYIADKILGFKRTIIFGAILLALGYGMIAFGGRELFFTAMSVIIIGNGLFKPNISSLLGKLYKDGDERREAGFTIFYVGINLGVLLSTLISGLVKQHFGWVAGFSLASVGLIIGLITFSRALNKLGRIGDVPVLRHNASRFTRLLKHKIMLVFCLFICGLFAYTLLTFRELANDVLYCIGIILIISLFWMASKRERSARNKMIALIMLTLFSVVFWAVFFQMFFSLNLFIDRDVNRQVFSVTIPTIAFISLEAIFIIAFGPLLAKLWQALTQRKINPSTPMKFALANFVIAWAFFILVVAIHFHGAAGLINPWWLVLSYFFVTIGELLLSPLGLSAVTVLSPPRLVGMLMGVWFVALGFGGEFAGIIAKFSSIPKGMTDRLAEIQLYSHAFFQYAMMALVVGIIILCCVPWMKRLIQA